MADFADLSTLYINERLSMKQIANLKQVSTATVFKKIHKQRIQPNPRYISLHPLELNLESSKELVYILGALLGDGTIYKNTYKIKLDTKDSDFATYLQNAFTRIGLHPRIFTWKNTNGTLMYRVQAYSKEFVEWYRSMNQDSCILLDGDLRTYLIRGFFDAEGYFSKVQRFFVSKKGVKKLSSIQFDCRIINTNHKLLSIIQKTINSLGFKTTIYRLERKCPRWKPRLSLYILGGKHEIIRFLKLIKPTIKYKRGDEFWLTIS